MLDHFYNHSYSSLCQAAELTESGVDKLSARQLADIRKLPSFKA